MDSPELEFVTITCFILSLEEWVIATGTFLTLAVLVQVLILTLLINLLGGRLVSY